MVELLVQLLPLSKMVIRKYVDASWESSLNPSLQDT